MEQFLVGTLQNNAPMLVLVALGFWRVLLALHGIERRLSQSIEEIDKRLVRTETKLSYPWKQRGGMT
jgi:hypothetical protein